MAIPFMQWYSYVHAGTATIRVILYYVTLLVDPSLRSSKGNEFFLGFNGNTKGTTSKSAAVILVTTDDLVPVNFEVEYFDSEPEKYKAISGNTTMVKLPIGRHGEPGDVRVTNKKQRNRAVRVKAEGNSSLTVYGINDVDESTDAFLALPCHQYDNVTNYAYFVFSTAVQGSTTTNQYQSQILIVSCKNDTSVTVIPNKTITHIPGDLTKTGSIPSLVMYYACTTQLMFMAAWRTCTSLQII